MASGQDSGAEGDPRPGERKLTTCPRCGVANPAAVDTCYLCGATIPLEGTTEQGREEVEVEALEADGIAGVHAAAEADVDAADGDTEDDAEEIDLEAAMPEEGEPVGDAEPSRAAEPQEATVRHVSPPAPSLEPTDLVAVVACTAFTPDALERVRSVMTNRGARFLERTEGAFGALVGIFEAPDGADPQAAAFLAARAAEEVRDGASASLGSHLYKPPATVRVALATGRAFSQGSADVRDGPAVKAAEDLARFATPGEILVTTDAADLLGSLISTEFMDGDDGSAGFLRMLGVELADGALTGASVATVGEDEARGREWLSENFNLALSQLLSRAVIVLGPPGSGKTRLVDGFLEVVAEEQAAVPVRVRCGKPEDDASGWPLAEMFEQVIDIGLTDPAEEVRKKVSAFFTDVGDEPVTLDWMLGVLGSPDAKLVREQAEWALRRFLVTLGRHGPVVLVVEDVDRSGSDLWELLRSVVLRTSGVALLLICTAADAPGDISALGEDAVLSFPEVSASRLSSAIAPTIGSATVDEEVMDVIESSSGGDAFLASWLMPMLVAEGRVRLEGDRYGLTEKGRSEPAPDGRAIAAFALDRLSPEEQAIMGLASVVGEAFPVDLVSGLIPAEREGTIGTLKSLCDSGLLYSERFANIESLSFVSAVLRDTASLALPEEAKAEIHENCAAWLEEVTTARKKRMAGVIGCHLLAAWETRSRAGGDEQMIRELARSAADWLEASASRSRWVGDGRAALATLRRAATVMPHSDISRAKNLLESAQLMMELGDPESSSLASQAENSARSAGSKAVEWAAKILNSRITIEAQPEMDNLEQALTTADRGIAVLSDVKDDIALAEAYLLRGAVCRTRGLFAAAAEASDKALFHARTAADIDAEIESLRTLAVAVSSGPLPIGDAVRELQGIVGTISRDRLAQLEVEGMLAVLMARQGRFGEARELAARTLAGLDDYSLPDEASLGLYNVGVIEGLAGEQTASERALRNSFAIGSSAGVKARAEASLAKVVAAFGSPAHAVDLTREAEKGVDGDDIGTHVTILSARALALARLGEGGRADSLMRRSLRLAEQTDSAMLRAEALLDLASILSMLGKGAEALPPAAKAQRIFERKRAEAQLASARRLITELSVAAAGFGAAATAE